MMYFSLILILSLKGFAGSSQVLNVPQKLYDSIKQTYQLEQSEIKPQMIDLLVEVKSSKGDFKLPVGYTQENIDLSQYLEKTDKSFTFQISTPYVHDDAQTVVYFLSRYKPFKSSTGKEFGYPCGTAFKIGSDVDQLLNTQPLTIAMNYREYVTVLGGDYLILHKESPQKMKISYFKIRDTRWTHELCTY